MDYDGRICILHIRRYIFYALCGRIVMPFSL